MNENEFTHDGVEYVAMSSPSKRCIGCAFKRATGDCEFIERDAPENCTPTSRPIGRNHIIWVKK